MSQDEDLDDLDDILDDFSAQPKPAPSAPKASAAKPAPNEPTSSSDASEADIARQMAALLSSLGCPDSLGGMQDAEGGDDDLTNLLAQIMRAGPEEGDQGEMDDAGFEQLLASLGQPPIPGSTTQQTPTTSQPTDEKPSSSKPDEPLSFEETIKRTMSNLKTSETSSRRAHQTAPPASDDPLAQLLASLNIDPSEIDLDALGAGGGPGAAGPADFSGVLDGMMKQLMTREILQEPLAELAEKYPAYLRTHGPNLSAAQRAKYVQQNTIVAEILDIFRDPAYSDASDAQRSRVTVLMTQVRSRVSSLSPRERLVCSGFVGLIRPRVRCRTSGRRRMKSWVTCPRDSYVSLPSSNGTEF